MADAAHQPVDLAKIVSSLPFAVRNRLDDAAKRRGITRQELVIRLLEGVSTEAMISNLLAEGDEPPSRPS